MYDEADNDTVINLNVHTWREFVFPPRTFNMQQVNFSCDVHMCNFAFFILYECETFK